MNDLITTVELVNIVNKALDVYHNTPLESYPEARGIDKLEELTPPNSRTRTQAFNLYMQVIDSLNEGRN